MDQVRSSIVRLRFIWEREEIEDESMVTPGTDEPMVTIKRQPMVIPGIIVSINDREEAVIIADATFFSNKTSQLEFWVSFPNSTGYEKERSVSFSEVVFEDFFCTLTLKPIEGGFIKPIQFETQPLERMDEVHSFVFPREEFITPTSYPNGFITCVSPKAIFHNCKMHEFGYLGSPVFNFRGDLVAITYLDKGQMQAWTVKSLLTGILHKKNSTLVSNGVFLKTT